MVDSIVRKGEIARYKQCLLFSKCFPQLYIFSVSKCGIAGNGLTLNHKVRTFNEIEKEAF